MKLASVLILLSTSVFAKGLFVHSFVHCGSLAKTRKILLYNAFTNRTLCDEGLMAYPASEIDCTDSNELIDRCKRPMECRGKFTCTAITDTTNRRRLVRQVREGENIPMYQKVDPFATLTESQEQKDMFDDSKSPASKE